MEQQDQLVQLMHKCTMGNQSAFAELYELTSSKLFGVVLRIVHREDIAQDVLQEAYVKIWHNANAYHQDKGTVITWMISIARYRALDALRRRKHDAHHDDIDEAYDLSSDAPGPLQQSIVAFDSKRLGGCMKQLKDKQAESIQMAYFYGMTHEEIGANLDTPLGTVKSWIRRGLISLKECVEA